MTPAPSRPNRFHKPPINLAAMARRVIARDRGDEPGKLYPDILDDDRQACEATQKRLAVLVSDRATHHAVQAAQGAEDGSTEALAEALDTLALTVVNMPETAPWLIKLAEAEMATRPLEATPAVTALLDTYGYSTTSIEGFIEAIIVTVEKDCTHMEKPEYKPASPIGSAISEGGELA